MVAAEEAELGGGAFFAEVKALITTSPDTTEPKDIDSITLTSPEPNEPELLDS